MEMEAFRGAIHGHPLSSLCDSYNALPGPGLVDDASSSAAVASRGPRSPGIAVPGREVAQPVPLDATVLSPRTKRAVAPPSQPVRYRDSRQPTSIGAALAIGLYAGRHGEGRCEGELSAAMSSGRAAGL
jgi:hypothetical protein